MLAAQAVAEAEETSRKASDLLDAANAVEELDHTLHERQSKILTFAIVIFAALPNVCNKQANTHMHSMPCKKQTVWVAALGHLGSLR